MLSISSVANSTKAGHYFDNDNYYAKDSPEAKELSGWWGKTAESLGLSGQIDREQFVDLLNGKMPNGEQLGIMKNGEYQHRHGYDLTFSAPKSVSLMLEIGGDRRLLTAHDKAVNATLAQIESDLASARITKKGETSIEQTGNLAVAKFIHDTSRALDPQLHTHAVVLNATLRDDGKIRSLASQSHGQAAKEGNMGFMERLFANKLYYGSLYRSHLAYEISQLGYGIEKTHRDGRFEIAGVDKEAIKHFSKRRDDIEQAMQTYGLEGGKQAAYATLLTRANKQDIAHDELRQYWQQEAATIGFNASLIVDKTKSPTATPVMTMPVVESTSRFDNLVQTLKEKFLTMLGLKKLPDKSVTLTPEETKKNMAMEAVAYAAAHLSERNAAFGYKELKHIAMSHALGAVSPSDIKQAVDQAFTSQVLLHAEVTHNSELMVTTKAAVELEKDTIAMMKSGQQQQEPLMPAYKAEAILQTRKLNPEQYRAALTILTSKDAVIGIQGYAGTGKTSMLSSVKQALEGDKQAFLSTIQDVAATEGMVIRGMAPSAAAASQLQKGAGIESQTLESFLVEMQRLSKNQEIQPGKQLWILDEASMASSRQMNELLKYNAMSGSHLVLVGDTKQLGAVEAGKPFNQLQQAGMETARLTTIRRQENKQLLSAVYDSINGDVKTALEKIGNNVNEIQHGGQRLQAVADAWLALSPAERKNTLVITPVNEDRQIVNDLIREGLKQERVIATDGTQTTCLQSEGLTLVEKTRAMNYQADMVVRFNRDYKAQKIGRNDYLTVVTNDKQTNTVYLKNNQGKMITWQPTETGGIRGAVEVFSKVEREMCEGDILRWTRNDKERGIINSQSAMVVNVQGQHATVKTQQGHLLALDLTKKTNQHWDYANAKTVYAAQGDTVTNVIAHDESFRKHLTNQRAFYVTISRAVEKVTLFVDDKEKYIKQLEEVSGEKISALEAIGQSLNQRHTGKTVKQTDSVKDNVTTDTAHSKIEDTKPQDANKHSTTESYSVASSVTNSSKPYYDKEVVREHLHANIEHVVEKLLGQPNWKLSNSVNWRYGKKGSLSVAISGNKQGNWHSFESDGGKQGGDIFSLIERETVTDFNGAVALAAEWVGVAPTSPEKAIKISTKPYKTHHDKQAKTSEDLSKIDEAKQWYAKSKPIAGTLAEKYLKQHRGIDVKVWSDSLHYLPANTKVGDRVQYRPSLLTTAKNTKGEIEAVQLIYLNNKTGAKADVDVQKRQYGRMRFGAYAVIQEGSNSKVMIAEGVETALSIAQANPSMKVVATLSGGNLTNIKLPDETKEVIICADNDKGKEHAMKVLAPAVERFQAQGKEVFIVFPTMGEPQYDKDGNLKKIDFNDVHKELGLDAVKEQTKEPEKAEQTKQNVEQVVEKNVDKNVFKPSQEIIENHEKPIDNMLDIFKKEPSYHSRPINIDEANLSIDSPKTMNKNIDETFSGSM